MKTYKRWLYVVVGVLALMICGIDYAWSVLSGPIAAEFPQWTTAQLSVTFTLVMIFFCVGNLAGGVLYGKLKEEYALWITAGLFLLGFYTGSKAYSLALLYLSIGVVCGFASGFGYNMVMSASNRWFPEKPGLISGILLMGFGSSSSLFGKFFQRITPESIGAWRHSYVLLGLIAFFCMLFCGFVLGKARRASFPDPADSKKKIRINPVAVDVPTGVMMRMHSFWLFYLWAVLQGICGLALISQGQNIALEVAPHTDLAHVASIVGLISIFNGLGRVIVGVIYDRWGREASMQTVNAASLFTGIACLIALKTGSLVPLAAGFIAGGISYGGIAPVNSESIRTYFGRSYYGRNLSILVTNMFFGSLGSTAAGAIYDFSHSYLGVYLLIGALGLSGIVVSRMIRSWEKKAALQKNATC